MLLNFKSNHLENRLNILNVNLVVSMSDCFCFFFVFERNWDGSSKRASLKTWERASYHNSYKIGIFSTKSSLDVIEKN